MMGAGVMNVTPTGWQGRKVEFVRRWGGISRTTWPLWVFNVILQRVCDCDWRRWGTRLEQKATGESFSGHGDGTDVKGIISTYATINRAIKGPLRLMPPIIVAQSIFIWQFVLVLLTPRWWRRRRRGWRGCRTRGRS